ncbi:hypothetical protein AB0N61_03800 [Microbacterium sp. NPDC089320]|uniref:hypothetical protein n=1 Tax=Microbacterium sp. NPDC089320 TaxID=3155182 RepID=UPI003445372B
MTAARSVALGARDLAARLWDLDDAALWGAPETPVERIVVAWAVTAEMLESVEPGTLLVCRAHPFFASPTHWRTPAILFGGEGWPFRAAGDDVLVRKRAALQDADAVIAWAPDLWHVGPEAAGAAFGRTAGLDTRMVGTTAVADIAPVPFDDLLDRVLPSWGATRALVLVDPPGDVRSVALLPGIASPDDIAAAAEAGVDTILCGEVVEWEGGPFAQDLAVLERPVGVAAVGTALSEQTVNEVVAERVRADADGLDVTVRAVPDATWTPEEAA